MEEVWLERNPEANSSVHLTDMPETPSAWRNDALAAKWSGIRAARRVVTAALEVQRTDKVIGASLEAGPVVHIEDAELAATLGSVPFDDICITSAITVSSDAAPAQAFQLPDVNGIAVVFKTAQGEKCGRCWKVLPDVGTHTPSDVCGRCAQALG